MAALTDTQLILLSRAAQRDDEAVVMPENLKGAVAQRVAQSLIDRGLIALIEARPGLPVWHRDAEGYTTALILTPKGRAAIGLEDGEASEPQDQRPALSAPQHPGGKQTAVLGLLSAPEGVSMAELTAATGWLPHSARAVLSGLRKKGWVIDRDRRPDGTAIYRSQPSGEGL